MTVNRILNENLYDAVDEILSTDAKNNGDNGKIIDFVESFNTCDHAGAVALSFPYGDTEVMVGYFNSASPAICKKSR